MPCRPRVELIVVIAGVLTTTLGCSGPSQAPTVRPLIGASPMPTLSLGGGCPYQMPFPVRVNTGWEQIYAVCSNADGTSSAIVNLSSGVLRVAPGPGTYQVSVTRPLAADLATLAAQSVVDSAPDSRGAVLVPAGAEAVAASTGGSSVYVSLDRVHTGSSLLAKSFGQYAWDKLGFDRGKNLLGNVQTCATSASGLWDTSGVVGGSTDVQSALTFAVDGTLACKSLLNDVSTKIGAAESLTVEENGLEAAAKEIGSGAWEDLLKLVARDPEILKIIH